VTQVGAARSKRERAASTSCAPISGCEALGPRSGGVTNTTRSIVPPEADGPGHLRRVRCEPVAATVGASRPCPRLALGEVITNALRTSCWSCGDHRRDVRRRTHVGPAALHPDADVRRGGRLASPGGPHCRAAAVRLARASSMSSPAPKGPGSQDQAGSGVSRLAHRPTWSAAYSACAFVKPSNSNCSINPERENEESSM
jgi:hypothetical protein